ncbi:HAMP domain-containing sensor histidine kinase [Leuconostoc falkenbergense]|uniref:HAMP domain-containing sensor histidine kinase n=1 Tax=Leuconostoc falkenbergense TaxID=2766470 RepID=UPI003F967CC3
MNHDGKTVNRSIFGIGNYLVYFLSSSLVVTVTILIIYVPKGDETAQMIRPRAIIALVIIIAMALLLTVINGLWRRYTIGRPVKKILAATQQVTEGDYNVQIQPSHGFDSINELDVIITNFNIMTKALGSVETLQTDFIASVSHEIKTPLAIIQNYATMIQDSSLPVTERERYATRIADATSRLSGLITNILALNKIDNQEITTKKDTYLLNEQIAEVLVNHETLWSEKNIDLQIDAEDVYITGDKELLALAWNNLVSNAIKFNHTNGKITVVVKTISDKEILVSIADSGIGLTEEQRQHIFDKFYQADTARSVQGNGLGLALVKRVIDIVGGQVVVTSQHNVGTQFEIKLPTNHPIWMKSL